MSVQTKTLVIAAGATLAAVFLLVVVLRAVDRLDMARTTLEEIRGLAEREPGSDVDA